MRPAPRLDRVENIDPNFYKIGDKIVDIPVGMKKYLCPGLGFYKGNQFSVDRFKHGPVGFGGDHQAFLGAQIIAYFNHIELIIGLVQK